MPRTGKRSRVGICNICGAYDQLTEDHVPPKGSVRITQMEMYNICEAMGAQRPEKKGKQFQNGIKFKSLCATCNNDYLGLNYDPALNEFSHNLSRIVKTPIAVPTKIDVPVQVNKVARAVLGHLMAVGLNRYNDGEMAKSSREYFLNTALIEPNNVLIYYWVYPYNRQILIRDATIAFDFGVEPPVFFWLMKYFPVSFFVTCDKPDNLNIRTNCLNESLTSNIDEYIHLNIPLTNLPKSNWPEAPTGNSVVALTDQAHGSFEKRIKRKKS